MSDLNKVKSKEVALVDVFERLQKHLADPKAGYPGDIIEKIVEQQEQSTPKLLEIAEKFFTYSQRDITYEQWREAMVAFFILSKFREKKAFPLVARLCKFPYESVERIFGDITTESLSELLASTFNRDWQELYSIALNQHFNEDSRAAVLDAYGILYKNDIMSREQVIEIFSKLFDALYDDFSYVPTALVCKCCDIKAIELFDKIKKYFDNNVVDENYVGLDEVEEEFALTKGQALESFKDDSKFNFTDDLQNDMGWLFREDADKDECCSECEDEEDDIVKF